MSVDHAWTPYGNPKVYPGCVRCSRQHGEHPLAVPPVILDASWRRMIREGAAASVFAGGWKLSPTYTEEPMPDQQEKTQKPEMSEAEASKAAQGAQLQPQPKRPAAGRGEAKDQSMHEQMEGK